MPRISVLMSVHQANDVLLRKSITSILGQTMRDFEVILVDDGMTPANRNIVEDFLQKDSRILLIRNARNLGLTKSLNKAAKLASGKYLARLDSDDICLPRRFERQAQFLDENNEYVLCGTRCHMTKGNIERDYQVNFCKEHSSIVRSLANRNPIAHPSMMIRKKAFWHIGGYDERYAYAQDYDLVFRLSKMGKLKNVNEVLVKMNFSNGGISSRGYKKQRYFGLKILLRAFFFYGGGFKTIERIGRILIASIIPLKLIYWRREKKFMECG